MLRLVVKHQMTTDGGTSYLDKDSEEEKEGLVHGGEVDTGVEGDEEHQLDEEAGVDEDVGEAGAESDEDAGGGGVLGRVDNTLRHDT